MACNLNLTKRLLAETADCDIFWMEEAFHEDRMVYVDLKQWMQAEDITTLIADGEGDASPQSVGMGARRRHRCGSV